jgi:hypothetical protein
MLFLVAKASQESPEIASANALQLLMMPVCVGPGAVTPVDVEATLLVVVVVVETAGAEMPTQ